MVPDEQDILSHRGNQASLTNRIKKISYDQFFTDFIDIASQGRLFTVYSAGRAAGRASGV